MSTWFPGLAGVIDKGFGGSRGGDPINGVVIHHTANGGGKSALDYVANENSRDSHPTYLVQASGAAYGIVHPDRRPYSTAGRPDSEAVSFEVDNSGGAPSWPISDQAISTVAAIIAHHYNESPKAGHGIARNQPGVNQSEFFVAWHSQYVATACPGPDMLSKIDTIIAAALTIAKGGALPTPSQPTEEEKARVRRIAAFLNGQGLASYRTAAEEDGIPLDPGEVYSRYWNLVQLWGVRSGDYDPNVYSVDGIVGPRTREVEAIIWALITKPADPTPEPPAGEPGTEEPTEPDESEPEPEPGDGDPAEPTDPATDPQPDPEPTPTTPAWGKGAGIAVGIAGLLAVVASIIAAIFGG